MDGDPEGLQAMDPVNVNNPDLWKSLGAIFGPGGLALLLALGASLYFNRMQWTRLKEKDEECAKDMTAAETRWETRFQQMRTDIKEAFGLVAKLTEQTTLLAERAKSIPTNMRVS